MYTDPSGDWIHILVGAIVGGVINVATNWNGCSGFGEFAAAFGAGALSGALTAANPLAGAVLGGAITSATNNMISQTGKNFSGNINWDQVGSSAGIGALAGLAGYGAGSVAGKYLGGFVTKGLNVSSPVATGAITGVLGGAAGGYAAGFTGGFIASGGDYHEGFSGGWNGLKTGAVIDGASGPGQGYINAKQAKLNPWTGKTTDSKAPAPPAYDFSPDPEGNNVKMYRGVTGSENKPGPLFLTEDANYASSYSDQVVEITISKTTYLKMQQNQDIYKMEGINYSNGQKGTEYIIYRQDIKVQFFIRFSPYKK